MIVSRKDAFKAVGISVVCFCAVFISCIFLNYCLDSLAGYGELGDELKVLYEAQLAMSKFTAAITGGVLSLIAAVMIVFYCKLYIDSHRKILGVLKSLGVPNAKLAFGFSVFALGVFVGAAVGFVSGMAIAPLVYRNMAIEGLPALPVRFRPWLAVCLVLLPTLIFGGLCFLYALFALRRPVFELMHGKEKKPPKKSKPTEKDLPFLTQMRKKTLSSKKSLAFFVAFAGFCFSAMTQMSLSMKDLSSALMGGMIFGIGATLAVVSLLMAVTSLVNGNKEPIALMKAFGYSAVECAAAILGGYVPFALLGFGIGTVYQFGLLKFMLGVIFKDYENLPAYTFDVAGFFITLAAFVVFYSLTMWAYARKLNRSSLKECFLGE